MKVRKKRCATATWTVVLALMCGAFSGCDRSERRARGDSSGTAGDAPQIERQWLGELSLQRSIGDTPETMLGRPAVLTAGPDGGFALVDFGDWSVKAFDAEGSERWTFGRQGAGPGEFSGFSALIYQPDGGVAVLDPELQRVTLIDQEGELVSMTRLPVPAHRLLPAHEADEDWVLAPRDDEHLWVAVSREGQRSGNGRLPPELRVEHSLLREPFASRSDSGAVIAFRWSSRLVFLDGNGRVRGISDGVETVDFPELRSDIPGVTRVDPEATRAARDVSAARGNVFVLFRGSEVVGSGVVDVYDEASMAYVGSYRVGRTVVDIAALADGRIATMETDSIPVVRIWSAPAGRPRASR